MSRHRCMGVVAALGLALGLVLAVGRPAAADAPQQELLIPYEPSPPSVVEAMLKLAKVGKGDVVYDSGCGDGRIVIMAVEKFGAKKGVGIDIDPERLKECKENAEMAGVTDRVVFKLGNILNQSYKEATVMAFYMLPTVDLMMRPIFYRDLKPGTRLVSHAFDMGEWEHDALVRPKKARSNVVYLWIIPASVGGTWEWAMKGKDADAKCSLALEQEFQFFRGFLKMGDAEPARIADSTLTGTEMGFNAALKLDGKEAKVTYRGTVEGDTIKGKQKREGGEEQDWTATRKPVDVTGTWHLKVVPADKSLDGTLCIEGKEGVLSATYALDKDKKPIPCALFVWGPSVRFEIPTGGPSVDFKGLLQGNAGSGVVTCGAGWTGDVSWTAEKARGEAKETKEPKEAKETKDEREKK